MSATIYTNASTGTKRVQLANGQALRRPIYLSNWTSMRIGLRLTFPSAANIVGTPKIWIGIGSGLTNGIGDATTTNWIGTWTESATWTRSTLVTPAIGYSSANARLIKRVGTTTTQNASGFITVPFFSLSDTFLSLILLDITKGSPNYTVNMGYPSSNSAFNGVALPGITETQMEAYMSLPLGMAGIGAVTNPNYSVTGGGATCQLAMSEAAGVLDTIQIYWDKTAVNCEIESVWHRKLA